LLRLFLGVPRPGSYSNIPDPDVHMKYLLMMRSFFQNNAVIGWNFTEALQFFLQKRFEIVEMKILFHDLCHGRFKESMHEIFGRIQTAIQINGCDQRLKSIGQQRPLTTASGLLLAPAKQQMRAQINLTRLLAEDFGADDVRLYFRHQPFGVLMRIRVKEKLADDKSQN